MLMDEHLDTGPMLLQREVEIPATMTAGELAASLAELGAELLIPSLDGLQKRSCETGSARQHPCQLRAADYQGNGPDPLEPRCKGDSQPYPGPQSLAAGPHGMPRIETASTEEHSSRSIS